MMEHENRVPCPYCKEMIIEGAVKCKECGTTLRRQYGPTGSWVWARNLPERKLLGVSACIAANCRISSTLVRVVFVLLTFASFLGVFLYLALAAVIPAEQGGRSFFEAVVDGVAAMLDNWFRKPEGTPAVATTPAPAPASTPLSPVTTAPPVPVTSSPAPPPIIPVEPDTDRNPLPGL